MANIEAAASQAAGIRGDLHTIALSHKLWSYEDLPQRRHVQHARLRPAALAEVRRCSFNVDQDEAELGAALLLSLLVNTLAVANNASPPSHGCPLYAYLRAQRRPFVCESPLSNGQLLVNINGHSNGDHSARPLQNGTDIAGHCFSHLLADFDKKPSPTTWCFVIWVCVVPQLIEAFDQHLRIFCAVKRRIRSDTADHKAPLLLDSFSDSF